MNWYTITFELFGMTIVKSIYAPSLALALEALPEYKAWTIVDVEV